MSHDIEHDDQVYYAKTPAWHKLGIVWKDIPTKEQAMSALCPHTFFDVTIAPIINGIIGDVITDKKAIFRSDGKYIATVGNDFEIVQPLRKFAQFEQAIDKGILEFDSGGSLCGGKRLWIIAKIVDQVKEVCKNDPIECYMLAYTAYDGSLCDGTQGTNTRVVCANTLAVARAKGSKMFNYRFKHTKNVHQKLDAIDQTIAKTISNFSHSIEAYKMLATKQVNDKQIETYVRACFEPENKDPDTDNSTRLENKISEVIELTHTQPDLELVPAMRGTMWQAYNGMTNYLTHVAGRTDDTRLNSQWFGANSALNQKALNLALVQ